MQRLRERILFALLNERGHKTDVWQLARRAGYLGDVIVELERMKRARLVLIEDTAVTLISPTRVPSALKRRLRKPLSEVMHEFQRYRERISFESEKYDQLALRVSAIRRKLSVMLKNGDLKDRDVLCLGDDDLFSIACSLTGLPKSITVFDIDKEILAYLRRVSGKLPIRIRAIKQNLIRPVPRKYQKKFDVFITEPPDTVKGTLLFTARGMACLRLKSGVFYLGITEQTLSREQWRIIEQAILEAGMTITDLWRDFEEYELDGEELTWKGFEKLPPWVNRLPKKPWFVSSLFRVEAHGRITPPKISTKNIGEELITSLLP